VRPLRLILLNTALLLVLLEGAARFAEWLRPQVDDVTFAYAPYRMLKMVKAPWPLNRDGFRARDWSSYRGEFLVEFLGGSVCLGVGTNPGPTVPERLEQALHNAGMSRARVVNLCQGGVTSAQELAIFLEYGLPLQPQVVVSFDGANDLLHPRPTGDDDAPNLPYLDAALRGRFERSAAGDLAAHLAMARVAARVLGKSEGAALPGVAADQIIESYRYMLDATRALAEASGGIHCIALQPTLHFEKPWSAEERAMWNARRPHDGAAVSDRVRELYQEARRTLQGRELYDLTGVFADTPQPVYSDSVHFTGEIGYRRLFEELQRQGLVERIAKRYRDWSSSRS
jgi:hypothetical protein